MISKRNIPADTSDMRLLYEGYLQLAHYQPDTAILLGSHVIKNYQTNLDYSTVHKEILIQLIWKQAALLEPLNNRDKLFELFNLSLKIQKELGDHKNVALTLNHIGLKHLHGGEVEKALAVYFEALSTSEKIKDDYGIAMALQNISVVYKYQGELAQAIKYCEESLGLLIKIDDKPAVANGYYSLAVYYNDYKDSLNYVVSLRKAAEAYTLMENKFGLASAHFVQGMMAAYQKKYAEALNHYLEGITFYKDLQDEGNVMFCLNNISNIHFELKNELEAIQYSELTLEKAKFLGSPYFMRNAAGNLHRLYKQQARWAEALSMYELMVRMQDSLVNAETQKSTIRHEMKYQYEKQALLTEQEKRETLREQSELKSRRDNLQYSVIFIGILLLLGLLFMSGFVRVDRKYVGALIFFTLLILFEFILVLADPYVEEFTGGAPGYKLLFNAAIASGIFPLHTLLESLLKKRMIQIPSKNSFKDL